ERCGDCGSSVFGKHGAERRVERLCSGQMNSCYRGVARTICRQLTAHKLNFASRPFAKELVSHSCEQARKNLRVTPMETLGAAQRHMSGKFLLWLQDSKILAGGFHCRLQFQQLPISISQSSPNHPRKTRAGESTDALSAE